MSHNSSRWLAASTLALVIGVAACGGSSASPTTAPASTPTPTAAVVAATPTIVPTQNATSATGTCPSGATVGAALGISLPNPVSVAGGGGTSLPAGAKGLACEYAGTGLNVIIELVTNIDPSSISLFSSKFPVAYTSVSGVGDQARAFTESLNGGKTNEAVVATKGSTLVAITATATPASLAQIEALANKLL